jgi:hypothetical protein
VVNVEAPPAGRLERSRWIRDTASGSSGRSRLAVHAGLLLLVLLALVPLTHADAIATPDEGVYLAQADATSSGTWHVARPAPRVDREGYRDAIRAELSSHSTIVPYPRHPLYTLLLTPFYAAGGIAGAVVLSTLGTWAAAIVAALIGRRLHPGIGPSTLWLVGLGSPLFFDAHLVAAHSVGAALCGCCFLGLHSAVERRSARPLLYALPAAALAVGVRTEAVIVVGVTGAVFGVVGAVRWLRRREKTSLVVGSATVAVAAVAYVVDGWATQAVSGSTTSLLPARRVAAADTGPANAAWVSLIRPTIDPAGFVNVGLILCVVSLVGAAIALRVSPRRRLTACALLAMATAAAVGMQFGRVDLIPGLLTAWPLLVATLLLLDRSDLRRLPVGAVLAISVVSIVAVVLTTYENGGSTQWGGRFFHLLLPTLAPVVVWSIMRHVPRPNVRATAAVVVCLALISLSFSAMAFRVAVRFRDVNGSIVTATDRYAVAHPSEVGRTLVVYVPLAVDGASRMFWHPPPDVDVLLALGAGDLYTLLERAKSTGYHSVVVLSRWRISLLEVFSHGRLDALGWQPYDTRRIPGTSFVLTTYSAAGHS